MYPYTSLTYKGDYANDPILDKVAMRNAIEVPDSIAEQWKAVRDAWRMVQIEAEEYLERMTGATRLD